MSGLKAGLKPLKELKDQKEFLNIPTCSDLRKQQGKGHWNGMERDGE